MSENKQVKSRRWFLKWCGLTPGVAGLSLAAISNLRCAGATSEAIDNQDNLDALIPQGGSDGSASDSGGLRNENNDATGGSEDTVEETDTGSPLEDVANEDAAIADAAPTEDAETEVTDIGSTDSEGEGGSDGGSQNADSSSPEGTWEVPDVEVPMEDTSVPEECLVTGSDVLGPFYEEGAPETTALAGPDEPGMKIRVWGQVFAPDCTTPLAGVLLDIWQADAEGDYHGPEEEYRLRGQMLSGEDGSYSFTTIKPGQYPLSGSFRPAHIHFTVSKPGYIPVTTQMYFEGDPFLQPDDPCGGCNSGDETLIVPLVPTEDPRGTVEAEALFNIVLAGA
jgi:protocatechuate 3,4-dioxygenase beta subunit